MPVTLLRSRLSGPLFLAAAALAGACQSVASSSGSGGGVAFAAPDTAAVPPPSTAAFGFAAPCPGYEPPTVGEDCSHTQDPPSSWDRTCEYGHDLDRACNDIYECTGATWTRREPPTCFERCPSTFAEIVPGAPCADSTMGCSYLEGTCACVADADAGASDADGGPRSGVWRCAPPPGNGCPPQRPPLGSDCVRQITCDYGACVLGRDVVYSCNPLSRNWVLETDASECGQ